MNSGGGVAVAASVNEVGRSSSSLLPCSFLNEEIKYTADQKKMWIIRKQHYMHYLLLCCHRAKCLPSNEGCVLPQDQKRCVSVWSQWFRCTLSENKLCIHFLYEPSPLHSSIHKDAYINDSLKRKNENVNKNFIGCMLFVEKI